MEHLCLVNKKQTYREHISIWPYLKSCDHVNINICMCLYMWMFEKIWVWTGSVRATRHVTVCSFMRARVRSDEWKSLRDDFLNSPLFVSLKFDVSRWSWTSLSQNNDPEESALLCLNVWNSSRTLKSTWQIHSCAETGFSSSTHSSGWSAGMCSGWSSAGFWIQEWCSDAFPSNPSDRHRGSPNAPPSPHVPEDAGIQSHRRESVSRGFWRLLHHLSARTTASGERTRERAFPVIRWERDGGAHPEARE